VVTNHTPINEILIDRTYDWSRKHWTAIEQSYGKAPFFTRYSSDLKRMLEEPYEKLADLTIDLTKVLAGALGISSTSFLRSSSLKAVGTKTDRLLMILKAVGATHYITGPAAKNYLDSERLTNAGVSIEYMDYNYTAYSQLYPPFDSQVSILDLLFMVGPSAPNYIWAI
jgi:hypothetical protein